MAHENALSIRFTEENYATRQEVAKALNTSLIDPLWQNILKYRAQYAKILPLMDVSKRNYSVTYTPNINAKYQNFQTKIVNAMIKYSKISQQAKLEQDRVHDDNMKKIIGLVAKSKNILINDVAINNIINERNRNSDYEELVRYYHAIKSLENNPSIAIDDDFFADYLIELTGQYELTSYYRTSDLEGAKTKFVVNREYLKGVPTQEIEKMMAALIDFIENSSAPTPVKAIVAFYYFNYIKPFDKFNEELSIILLKAIIARSDCEVIAPILPFEILIAENKMLIDEVSLEVQRTRDVTYLVIAALNAMDHVVSEFLDEIVNVENMALKDAYLRGMSDEEFKKEFNIDKNETQFGKTPFVRREEAEAPHEEKAVEKKIVKQSQKEILEPNETPSSKVTMPLHRLSEEEYEQMEIDLLESDPLLRPQQAHFYVRHRTVGKYYTIQQFKKAEGCVYETARTSMDNLAKRGYYRRENLKNKFVYTPVAKE